MRRLLAVVAVVAGTVLVPMAVPADAGGGCHIPEPTEGTGATVAIEDRCFTPTILRVAPGTTVTFVNRDELDHNLSGVSLDSFDEMPPGKEVRHHYDAAGTYPYMCALHPAMTGAIVVDEPVLAASRTAASSTGDDGVPVGIAVAIAVLAAGAGVVIGRRGITPRRASDQLS